MFLSCKKFENHEQLEVQCHRVIDAVNLNFKGMLGLLCPRIYKVNCKTFIIIPRNINHMTRNKKKILVFESFKLLELVKNFSD